MERVGLKEEFHGEPDPNEEGMNGGYDAYDEVVLNIVGGTVKFVVPSEVPDDRVARAEFMERFVSCRMQLENGTELNVWINAGAHGVELELEPRRGNGKHGSRARLRAEREWR
jgi:hypothetical protein